MDPEERELQIKIAKLNNKLQFCIASVFGLLAFAGGLLVGGIGIIITVPKGISVVIFRFGNGHFFNSCFLRSG